MSAASHTPGPVGGLVGDKYAWTIRRARKEHYCYCCPPHSRTIRPGDLYVEADVDPYDAGGFGHERMCLAHLEQYEQELVDETSATEAK